MTASCCAGHCIVDMSVSRPVSDPAKAMERTRVTRQKGNPCPSNVVSDALVQAASDALQTKRELAAALLIENRNAVLIGANVVFFGPQDAAQTIMPLSHLACAPAPIRQTLSKDRSAPNQQRQKIHLVPQAVERGHELRRKNHGPSCDCTVCQDDRKWEQRFEKRYGAVMRAYYARR
jgi:hypothetical protein